MPTKDPPVRGETARSREVVAKMRAAGQIPATKAKPKAKPASPATVANLRARVKELEQDKRLLRSALDRAEQQLKGKGVR